VKRWRRRGAYTAAAVSKGAREAISDWLMLLAAPILFISLFLVWSHQFSHAFLARYARLPVLAGVPRDPTAWQVYSVADVLLAVLAVGLLLVALRGSRPGRLAVLLGLAVALAFVIHAVAVPPTTGADLFDPGLQPPRYTPNAPSSGGGEIVALVGLVIGTVGVVVSFTAD
jgi:hypothetical protein